METGAPDWQEGLDTWFERQHFGSYRPLVTLYELVLLALFGVNPFPLHVANVILHGANAALLGLVCLRLGLPERGAIMATAVFATSPLLPEAVIWFAGNPVLLCGAFGLLAMLALLDWLQRGQPRFLLFIVIAAIGALLSKEEGLAFPPILAWLAVWFAACSIINRQTETRSIVMRAAVVILICACIVAGYFGLRYALLGAFTPEYYTASEQPITALVKAIFKTFETLGAPINQDYWGDSSFPILSLVASVYGLFFLFAITTLRQNWSIVVLFLVIAIVAMGPAHQILSYGIDQGLTNSRFSYLPALGMAGLVGALIAGPARSNMKRFTSERFARNVAIILVSMQLAILTGNNRVWAKAGVLMKRLQTEAMTLSNGDPLATVVNVPRYWNGVIFDVGGWSYARFQPFVTDGPTPWVRQASTSFLVDRPVHIVEVGGTRSGFAWRNFEESTSAYPAELTLTMEFNPIAAGYYESAIEIRSNEEDQCVLARVSASGRGHTKAFDRTGLSASIVSIERSQNEISARVHVSDAPDGVPALSLRVDTPDSSPWSAQLHPLDTSNDKQSTTLVDLADGQSAELELILKRNHQSSWPRFPLMLRAANAPPIVHLPRQEFPRTIIELDRSIEFPEASASRITNTASGASRVASCERPLDIILDAGVLPIEKQKFDTGDPIRPAGVSGTPELFWDSENEHVVRFSCSYEAPNIMQFDAPSFDDWHTTPDIERLQISSDVYAFKREAGPPTLESPPILLDPRRVAYALIEIRVIGATNPVGLLSWTGEDANGNIVNGSSSYPTWPDGEWRVDVVPLHQSSDWSELHRVQHLRFTPFLASGYAEIRSVRLIGSIPQRCSNASNT